MINRVFCAALTAATIFVPALARCDEPLTGTHPAQYRLIWTSDPVREAILSWSTAQQGRDHRLHVRSSEGGEERIIDAAESARYSAGDENVELYYHHALLKELQPDTKYFVTMESDGDRSRELHFRTAPAEDRPLKIIFGGDSRSDQKARRKVNELIARLVTEDDSILALSHGGDYIASGRKLSQWSEWMSDHELTITADGRLLPIVPTRGNHDGGPLFNEVFGFPATNENYYGVQLGPQIRLVTLNTETSIAGDQADWLAEELQQHRPKVRWLLAQYHRPAFPAVKIPSGALQHWVPLFEQYNVDLVCEADGHCIKRTPPIRDNRVDESGVVYIGEGGFGVPQRTPKRGRWYLNPPGMTSAGHHVTVLAFSSERLEGKVVGLEGQVLDTFSRSAR